MGAHYSKNKEIPEEVIQQLVATLLRGSNEDRQREADNLTSAINRNCLVGNVFTHLISSLTSCSSKSMNLIMSSLSYICVSSTARDKLRELNASPALLHVASMGQPKARKQAINILRNLAISPQFPAEIQDSGAVDLFISVALTQKDLLAILYRCAFRYKPLLDYIAKPDALATLVKHTEVNMGYQTTRELCELLADNGYSTELIKAGIFDKPTAQKLALVLKLGKLEALHASAEDAVLDIVVMYLREFDISILAGENTTDTPANIVDSLLRQAYFQTILNKLRAIDKLAVTLKTTQGPVSALMLMTLLKNDPEKIYEAITRVNMPTSSLRGPLQTLVVTYLQSLPATTVTNVRDEQAPWYIDPASIPTNTKKKYHIMPGQPEDFAFVAGLYDQCPVPGYDIKDVRIVCSEHLLLMFAGRIALLQGRHTNKAFKASWEQYTTDLTELEQRKKIMDIFTTLARPHFYNGAPNVSFMPLWHGTKPEVLDSVFTTGFANLAKTDAGFFGKGLYSTANSEYAHRAYSSGALLVNWVASYSTYPVIAKDEEQLSEKGNFENYDSHFIPVFSPKHPKTTNYHACNAGEQHQYTEMVVFESSQMLPHYIVELQPALPRNPSLFVNIPTISPLSPASSLEDSAFSQRKPTLPPKLLDPTNNKAKPVKEWNADDVCTWVSTLRLSQSYIPLLKTHPVFGAELKSMIKQDWQEIGVTIFGDIRVLMLNAAKLV